MPTDAQEGHHGNTVIILTIFVFASKTTALMESLVLISADFEWALTTFSLLKCDGKSLVTIAAYCRRTLLIVWKERERQCYNYSLFVILLLDVWNSLTNFKQWQAGNKIISKLINIPKRLLRSMAKSLTVRYYFQQEHSGFTGGGLTFAKRHMKWARACGFGHSSFLIISKLWFSWVNTSTTEQEKRACSEVCWNCGKKGSLRRGQEVSANWRLCLCR